MSATEATAEVFVTAFKALKPRVQEAVLLKMVGDSELAEDLFDLLTAESRRGEPTKPLGEVLAELKVNV